MVDFQSSAIQSKHMHPLLSSKHKEGSGPKTVCIEATSCFVWVTVAMQEMVKLPRARFAICHDFVNQRWMFNGHLIWKWFSYHEKPWQSPSSSSQHDADRKREAEDVSRNHFRIRTEEISQGSRKAQVWRKGVTRAFYLVDEDFRETQTSRKGRLKSSL